MGHVELENVCWMLEDCQKYTKLYHELAASGYVEIRKHVAGLQYVEGDTFLLLLEDSSIDVLREVVTNDEAKKWIKKEHLERYLELGDTEMVVALAADVDFYANEQEICDLNWLCEKISNHRDPSVRLALAENEDVPAYLLIKLSEDEDILVAEKAKETLSALKDDDPDDLDEWEDD
jgi:hypothetical protein